MTKRQRRESQRSRSRDEPSRQTPRPVNEKLQEYQPQGRADAEGRDTPPERGQSRDRKSPWLGGG